MFFKGFNNNKHNLSAVREMEAQIAAMERSQAVIEFNLDSTILRANTNFLSAMGYTADEVVGRRHAMFVDPVEAASPDYAAFWAELKAGRFVARKFLRFGKGGRKVWIQASYNPVLDENGTPYKVVKFAADVTEAELSIAEAQERVQASAEAQQVVVTSLAKSLQALSGGDLTTAIGGEVDGSYAQIRNDFNGAVGGVRETIVSIASATNGLKSGAGEIAGAADDLSRRTEQQAASLEQSAAALDEIAATIARSAEGAGKAAVEAGAARAAAVDSGQVVQAAVDAMGEIEESSRKITQIIAMIVEIAFQTNLLALNAGVEAARAGESGRGFAVVAAEVRTLSQRTSEASQEISNLITESSRRVAAGADLVSRNDKSLAQIGETIDTISAKLAEVAAAAAEQSETLRSVNGAVSDLDQGTQRNASMFEETRAATMQLADEAQRLNEMIRYFRLDPNLASGAEDHAKAGSLVA